MPDPVLVPFRADHLLTVTNRDTARQESLKMMIEKEQNGPAFTGVLGETILGCAGIVIPWSGVGFAWMVLSENIGAHSFWMTRMVKRFLHDMVRCYSLHRLEAIVLAENERNQRWIERLGFSRENGAARHYTSDRKDIIRYERIGRM